MTAQIRQNRKPISSGGGNPPVLAAYCTSQSISPSTDTRITFAAVDSLDDDGSLSWDIGDPEWVYVNTSGLYLVSGFIGAGSGPSSASFHAYLRDGLTTFGSDFTTGMSPLLLSASGTRHAYASSSRFALNVEHDSGGSQTMTNAVFTIVRLSLSVP
jgi:hypothetical protein